MGTVCQSCGKDSGDGHLFCPSCGTLFIGNGKVVVKGGAKNKVTFGNAPAKTPAKSSSKKKGSGSSITLATCTADDLASAADDFAAIAGEYFVKCGRKHVYFGSYPQTLKAPSVQIISTKPEENGYYLGSDGAYYAQAVAVPLQPTYTFQDKSKIQTGKYYYFKVEPIKWRILTSSNGVSMLLAENILCCRRFSLEGGGNNYERSYIRSWLNDDFVRQAFNMYERIFLREYLCDNGVASTGYDANPYASVIPTHDYVFLPSIKELMDKKLGFESSDKVQDAARRKVVTDYARALGTGVNDTYGTCQWWTRSPACFNNRYARPVEATGGLNLSESVGCQWTGVVPAILVAWDGK